ncbi:MAG: hypothetical protein M0R06_23420 [Sphaerochaeta sp.]|jgi:hypothetical protein|nr:hypothetical protein [Sphaerochaeta sp.]
MKPEEILALAKAISETEEKSAKAKVERGTVLPVDMVVRVRGTVKVGQDGEAAERTDWKSVAGHLFGFLRTIAPGQAEDCLSHSLQAPADPALVSVLETAESSIPRRMVPRAGSARAQVCLEIVP